MTRSPHFGQENTLDPFGRGIVLPTFFLYALLLKSFVIFLNRIQAEIPLSISFKHKDDKASSYTPKIVLFSLFQQEVLENV